MSQLTGAVPLVPKTWRRYGLGAVLFLAAFGLLGAPTARATVIDELVWNGHRYYLISENTASRAELEAQSLGGHLTAINTQQEHDFLWSTWGGNRGTGLGLWIGLTDRAAEGTWVWMNGDPVTFTNWASGEPNNGTGRYLEDFVNMDSRFSTSGKWNDVPDAGPGWRQARGVVELSHAPEPITLLLVGSGAAAGAVLRRCRRI